MSASTPGRRHTKRGYATARATLESEHRYNGHADSKGREHYDAFCKLCVEQAYRLVSGYGQDFR